MKDLLADTHSILWLLFEPGRLSQAASRAFLDAQAAGGLIFVSAMTPVEVTYLVEKQKLAPAVRQHLWAALDDPQVAVDVLPVSAEVARALERVPRAVVPNPQDRIISATALAAGLPLVSKDEEIRALSLPEMRVIW